MALPFCYVAGLVLVVALPGTREKLVAAATATLLMILNYAWSSAIPGVPGWVYLFNHALALLMIWTVTVLSLRHRHAQEVMRENERVANERLAHLKTIYASAPVGLCFVDRDLHYVSINNALAEMSGRSPEFYIGKTVREAVPELADSVEGHYHRVIDTGQPVIDEEVQINSQGRPQDRRICLCSYYPVHTETGQLLGVNVAVRDITRRKQAEADTLFLLDLGEGIRFAADADELLWAVAVALGEHLKASRCAFLEVDAEQDRITVQRDYHPHLHSLVGTYSRNLVSPTILSAAEAGQIIAVADARKDERIAKALQNRPDSGIGALVITPLLRDGALVSALVVANSETHEWTEREITLVNIVAERTWLAVERLRLDSVLRESDAALRDADRRKDEFLATLAHELRNPLSLVRNVITLQKTPAAPEADPFWGQDIIERQVGYLTRLTDDLFDVSRITRDKLVLQKEVVSLAEIIRGAVESSRPLIDQRQHELTVTVSQESIYVEADRVRLTQVFMNLLNNAAKYTPNPGHIWVNVEQAGDTVIVRVKDTGIGIAAENLPHLFELFYQVDRSFTRSEGGLGLGLTLVHRLIEMHAGKVEVRSDGINRGTEFIVSLPVVPVIRTSDHIESMDAIFTNMTSRSRRILVADDFPQSAAILARLLRQDGNEVQVAQDGIQAVETAAEFRPDVAVLDIAMPKLDGFDVARMIREQPWGKNMFLIALSGWGQQLDRQRTKEAGFDAHLTKPAKYETLMEILNGLPLHEVAAVDGHREL
ncbi:MAG TPA: ATP-binding protein [Candidatus Binatia bacterium]|nr:ATP-binding protein [Candidatus Binatia bacterium]